ncbi:Zinc cluster transcription factor CZF1 [Colletotrichum chlorophyti]|uniref:Zinc cluster transcription factor CZF1 n=1 Tax=Colletotrichum chlorophyti TaxID=708187 RepID=A0A1Q8RSD6_9PEZI|nr:Zinc cluster transcription factor CZF1 [Colletotrichum chlorophyti]
MSSTAPRPRRTLAGPIFRVRTGCLTCRGRKKKCDETKPRCRGCERNRLECRWPASTSHNSSARSPREASVAAPVPASVSASASASDSASASASEPTRQGAGETSPPCPSPKPSVSSPRSLTQRERVLNTSPVLLTVSHLQSSESPDASSTDNTSSPSTTRETVVDQDESVASPSLCDTSVDALASFDFASFSSNAIEENEDDNPMDVEDGRALSPLRRTSIVNRHVPRAVSFLPGSHDSVSLELMSHYLGATTISMANGSTLENPFSEQLIPLAFSSDLVLQLLLTQSAVHRASKSLVAADRIATKYYNQSLRLFQQHISNFMGGQQGEETLILGVSALIFCLIETAKGDINGATYDHLMAAQSLLLPSLLMNNSLQKVLKDFLVEYYVYTATVSMISIDARLSNQLFLSNDLVLLATDLVASAYVGNLCGCWLELLLFIPSVFDFGRRLMVHADDPSWRATSDDFLLFAQLLNQIQNWTPNPAVSPDVIQAGYIYQKAILLYLYTAMNALEKDETGLHAASIQTTLAEALSHLAQLPPSVRINTSLCWPIAVIGSCVVDPEQQTFLRDRLGHMFSVIGLGNMTQTTILLRHIWEQNEASGIGAGPWNICRVMNEKQIWLSFA